MTAPDTNLNKQKKRHKGPLIGMAVAVNCGGPVSGLDAVK